MPSIVGRGARMFGEMRPVQIWVPDTSAPGFAEEAARQCRLLAAWEASSAGRDEMAFWDELAQEAWDTPD
jgi:hypothetical protein